MHYFYEMQATHGPDLVTFPAVATATTLPSPTPPVIPPTLAMPATIPPRLTLCPNCKRLGHTIEFCIAPGGKMAGQSTFEASNRQRAALGARPCPHPPANSSGTPANTSGSLVRFNDDGTVWIARVKYNHERECEPTTAAIADINGAMTMADLGEYHDWAVDNTTPEWEAGNDNVVDSTIVLLASVATSLLAQGPDLPIYLDSGASAHIFCKDSDFLVLEPIAPRHITGVGNASVSATGIGTVEISLPGVASTLTLRDVLFSPTAGVRLVSISQLDDSGYRLSFDNGMCTLFDHATNSILAECQKNSSHLYVLPGSCLRSIPLSSIPLSSIPLSPSPIPSSSSPHVALPSLVAKPNLETWHRRLSHANFQTILDMACTGVVTGMPTDLSLTPQACDPCIRGKQTHCPVPK